MFKSVEYDILVSERIECRRCEGLKNPSVVEGGRFDSSEIGPWSRWQGSLDARLMIVGQDWGDVRYFTRHSGREGAANPTNDMLQDLVRLLGIDVGQPGDQRRSGVAFFTNAVLCLKDGGLQSRVRPQWFTNCATFLRRQVEIVAPKLLVCLGESSIEDSLPRLHLLLAHSTTWSKATRGSTFRTEPERLLAIIAEGAFRTLIDRLTGSGKIGFGLLDFFAPAKAVAADGGVAGTSCRIEAPSRRRPR